MICDSPINLTGYRIQPWVKLVRLYVKRAVVSFSLERDFGWLYFKRSKRTARDLKGSSAEKAKRLGASPCILAVLAPLINRDCEEVLLACSRAKRSGFPEEKKEQARVTLRRIFAELHSKEFCLVMEQVPHVPNPKKNMESTYGLYVRCIDGVDVRARWRIVERLWRKIKNGGC